MLASVKLDSKYETLFSEDVELRVIDAKATLRIPDVLRERIS
ncbi:MAG: hypothetical protein AB8B57_16405 [Congregibacter sp.]